MARLVVAVAVAVVVAAAGKRRVGGCVCSFSSSSRVNERVSA